MMSNCHMITQEVAEVLIEGPKVSGIEEVVERRQRERYVLQDTLHNRTQP